MGGGNQWKVGTSVVGVRTSGRWEPVRVGTSVGGGENQWKVRTSGEWELAGGGNQWEVGTKGPFSRAG